MALTVLHIGKYFPPHPGGMEVFLADLIEAQGEQGVNAHALVHGTPHPDDPEWLTRVPVQATLIYAPIAKGFRRALAQVIDKIKPDVLHLHMPNNSVFWALTLSEARHIPWVVHWHADVVASNIRLAVKLAYRLYRPFEQAVLKRAERIIATSPPYLDASEPLQQWREKCTVVPLGLSTTPGLASSSSLESTPWQHGSFRLLAVGRLAYYKGFETLVEAVSSLPGVELLIAGEGESRPALESLIQSATPGGTTPQVRLLGHVTDAQKYSLLASCDVFCLPSRERTEAFGMVLLEAMSQARPCIASNLAGSGMPWVVTQAQAGLLAEPENPLSWQQAITHLKNKADARLQMGENGRLALHRLFGINACAEQISHHYTTVVANTAMHTTASKDVLIVIPAKNEAPTIGAMLQQLHAAGWQDIVVIDDQSTDGTGDIARNAGAHVLQPVLPVGAWGGMQAGIRYGLAQGYQAVITMDADGQHEVIEINSLLNARYQSDVVIGAFPERASPLRKIAWRWFRQLAGFDLRDLTSGFRLYNRKAMVTLAMEEASLLDYQDLGALLLVRRAGLHIVEVPVSMNLRTAGASRIFHSWLSVAQYMAVTTLLCMARWRIPKAR